MRDVTGWPTRAVEEYRLLAATAHVNHVHLERPALGVACATPPRAEPGVAPARRRAR